MAAGNRFTEGVRAMKVMVIVKASKASSDDCDIEIRPVHSAEDLAALRAKATS